MALWKNDKKGETGRYYATFKPEEIVQRTQNMFKTIDGGLHTFNGQIDDDLCSNQHDYSGDPKSMMAYNWKDELKKQAKLDAEKAQQAREVAEFKAMGGVPLGMDDARRNMNASVLENYNKETSEKIQNKEEGYVVSPKKEESVDDILNGKMEEVYKSKSDSPFGGKDFDLGKNTMDAIDLD